MKKASFLFLLAVSVFIGCQSGTPKTETAGEATTSFAKDSVDIRNIVLSFYSWYSTNYEKLQRYDLYSGSGKQQDMPPYTMNWDVVKQYRQFIRDSVPQLGNAFQANLEQLLKKADSSLKGTGEGEVPEYFDYDWYMNTQEDPVYIFNEMKNSRHWTITLNGEQAKVEVKGFDDNGKYELATVIFLEMKKEDGVWKISRIGEM